MSPSTYVTIVNLIPPAAALAVLAYFTRLFGKVIADQKPYVDNREWDIEFGGIMFMLMLAPGVLGIAAALYWPHLSYWWMHIIDFVVLAALYAFLHLVNRALSLRFYDLDIGAFINAPKQNERHVDFFCRIGKSYPIAIVPIILFYIGTIEYLSQSPVWIILMWPLVLYLFILLALNLSFRKMDDRVGVDIYFTGDTRAPLKNVIVLKITDEILRVRDGKKSILINKDELFKIELTLPDKYLPKK